MSGERERIADALVDLCHERGYRNTTLAALLERAGVDRATFTRHYGHLENCFCEVYAELQDDLMERLLAVVSAESTWRDRLRAVAYELADYIEEDESRTQFMVIEVRSAGDRAIYLLSQSYERLFDLIDMGRGERPRRRSISRATAEAVGGSMFFQMYSSYEPGSIDAVRARVPELMYMAVLPYLGPEAAAEELLLAPQPA